MSLTVLQNDVHNLILSARRIERVIESPDFEALYSTLSVEDKAHVARLVKDLLTNELIQFIQTKLKLEVGEQSIRQLRITASRYRVTGYSTMSKENLIRAILHEQARLRSGVGQTSGMEGRPCGVPQQSQEGTQRPRALLPVLV